MTERTGLRRPSRRRLAEGLASLRWINVLSLDAPAVALVWQALLAEAAGVPLGWHHRFLLAVAVWLAYALDRWLEAVRLPAERLVHRRHRFAAAHRQALAVVWSLALVLGVAVAIITLPAHEWLASMGVLVPVLTYLLSHQWHHRDSPLRVPKEACTAGLMAVGCAVYPAAAAGSHWVGLVPGTLCFFLVALGNCLLIAVKDRAVDRSQGQQSIAHGWRQAGAAVGLYLGLVIVGLLVLGELDYGVPRLLVWASGMAAVGLLALGIWPRHLTEDAFRQLADAALVLPMVLLVAP